jgi:hypothetical protein
MTQADGYYYWYFPSESEVIPDLQGEPRVVELFDEGRRLAHCGSDVTIDVEECQGVFVGPLSVPPLP